MSKSSKRTYSKNSEFTVKFHFKHFNTYKDNFITLLYMLMTQSNNSKLRISCRILHIV